MSVRVQVEALQLGTNTATIADKESRRYAFSVRRSCCTLYGSSTVAKQPPILLPPPSKGTLPQNIKYRAGEANLRMRRLNREP